jgi:LmbE family N-acetylglucosaminyl deacetylase
MREINEKINKIIQQKAQCIFISPHLDDAASSCGNLIKYLRKKTPVLVLTVFTEGSSPPYSSFTTSFMNACGYNNAKAFFRSRRKEDTLVFKTLKVAFFHLGFIDAAWRQVTNNHLLRSVILRIFPSALFLYPKTVFKNQEHVFDKSLIDQIYKSINALINKTNAYVIFSPLAVGSHVDHLLVRKVCEKYFPQTIYWLDYPYMFENAIPKDFIKKKCLRPSIFRVNSDLDKRKYSLLLKYKSQISAIFPKNKIVRHPEVYYLEKFH